MSIPIIEKHSFGKKNYLMPSDFREEVICEAVYSRERFITVTELLRRLDRIDCDDFAISTNKYFIAADNINDAYIAVLAIYYSIAAKDEDTGEAILFEDADADRQENNAAVAINLTAGMNDPDLNALISNDNNPVIHMVPSLSPAIADSEMLLNNKTEFFICYAPDGRLSGGAADDIIGMLGSCFRCMVIENSKAVDVENIICSYFWERDFECDNTQKEIALLVKQLKGRDEYAITAAARQIVSNHLFNDPDDRQLLPEDFRGIAELFSLRPIKQSSKRWQPVGLEKETEKINGIINSISIDKLRYEKRLSDSFSGCSMVFAGPPGTAKTTLARRFAEELAVLRIIKDPSCFKECCKSDYVGQYVGHTAAKIDAMFAEMAEKGGGVLFFDEIYTLAEDNATIFDKEAVTCIVQNMENYRNCIFCIFAGYEDKMNDFLGSNPGLRSRISFIVRFSGYSDHVLCDIFSRMAAEDNYKIPADSEASVISFFKRLRAARGEQFGNGREARNLYINAKQHHALRIGGFKTKTKKMLTELDTEDISAAAEDILSSELKSSQSMGSIGF